MVEGIREKTGVSVLVAMHDLTLAGQYCHRVAALYQGSIYAVGEPSEVLTTDLVSKVFGAPGFDNPAPRSRHPRGVASGPPCRAHRGDRTMTKGEHRRVTGGRVKKGLVVVNTGKWEGEDYGPPWESCSERGGRDMRGIMLQFIKQTNARFGERRAAEKIGVEMQALGDGFTWRSKDLEHTADLARQQWEKRRGEDQLGLP